MLHQVGISSYFMRKMHRQTTLKEFFCLHWRFCLIHSCTRFYIETCCYKNGIMKYPYLGYEFVSLYRLCETSACYDIQYIDCHETSYHFIHYAYYIEASLCICLFIFLESCNAWVCYITWIEPPYSEYNKLEISAA